MVKVITGKKGVGKTKKMVEMANEHAQRASGNIVFIDDDNRVMFELDSSIRFVNLTEFHVDSFISFYGFICGMISSNYDIQGIYVDGLAALNEISVSDLDLMIHEIELLSKEYGIEFFLCFNSDVESLTPYVKERMMDLSF